MSLLPHLNKYKNKNWGPRYAYAGMMNPLLPAHMSHVSLVIYGYVFADPT